MKYLTIKRRTLSLTVAGAAAILLLTLVTVLAAGERLPRSLVSSGGGPVGEGGVTLRSAIGQPIAGVVREGIALCSGFLCGDRAPVNQVDTIPPAVTATQPDEAETDVPLNQFIDIFFREAMDTTSVRAVITPSLTVTPTWSNGDTRLTLVHAGLTATTRYTTTVSAGSDPTGNGLANAPYTWSFTTGTDTARETDLALTKQRVSSGPITAGQRISYTFTVTNYGPTAPVSATLVDTFSSASALAEVSGSGCSWVSGSSAVTCAVDEVSVGAPVSLTLVVTTQLDFDGSLSNSAVVAPATGTVDTNPVNDSSGPVTVYVNAADGTPHQLFLPHIVRLR
jgi:uncharacterized repeat protein (TIGR01451 family)